MTFGFHIRKSTRNCLLNFLNIVRKSFWENFKIKIKWIWSNVGQLVDPGLVEVIITIFSRKHHKKTLIWFCSVQTMREKSLTWI